MEIIIEHEGGYVIKLKGLNDGREFNVEANYSDLPKEDIHTIFEAGESKASIQATINAWFVGDRITRAAVVRANKLT